MIVLMEMMQVHVSDSVGEKYYETLKENEKARRNRNVFDKNCN